MTIHPIIKSALTAGGISGTAYGFATQGENLEAQGLTTSQQIIGGLKGGAIDGAIGAGVGLGISGTGLALAKILRK